MNKKLLIAAAMVATLSPMAAQAQSGELRRDRQDIREEQRELNRAQRRGDYRDVREERRDVRHARQEYREDWQDYRRDNRNAFRGTRFVAPFRYRTFNPGVRLSTSYYGPRYYVNNYSNYRLHAPGRNQRYIRHYNDLLLVNVRSGVVIRAYHNFYW